MTTQTITGKVTRVERMGSSYYGNPYFKVAIETPKGDIVIHRTRIDSSVNYGIENREFKENESTFKLTKAGRIYAIERNGVQK